MTPVSVVGRLFHAAPQPAVAQESTGSPATVELRPVLQRRSSPAAVPALLEGMHEALAVERPISGVEAEENPRIIQREPAEKPPPTEQVIERVRIARELRLPPQRAMVEPDAADTKSEPSTSTADTAPPQTSPVRPAPPPAPEPSRVVTPEAEIRSAPPLTPPPPIPAAPAPVEPQRAEPERTPISAEPRREAVQRAEPPLERPPIAAPVAVQPAPQQKTESVPAPEIRAVPLQKEIPTPSDQAAPEVPPPPITSASSRPAPRPAAPREEIQEPPQTTPQAVVTMPVARLQLQRPAIAEPPAVQPSAPAGVTLRIGRIEIVAHAKVERRMPKTTRPARSHQIEPHLPFAPGRW
jgi:hypothetical protein